MTTGPNIFNLRDALQLALFTVRDPRRGGEAVLSLGIPSGTMWQLLALVVVISTIMGQGSLLLVDGSAALAGTFFANPVYLAGIQFALLAITVQAIYSIGRLMGGQGTHLASLTLITWLQFMMACLQVVQTALLFLMPLLADLLGFVGLGLFLWLLTHFVALIHGFRSLGMVFVMVMVSAFGIVFLLTLVLAIFGFGFPGDFDV